MQVLDSAQQRITLVSYAVYKIPRIQDALVRAAQRHVAITVIVETPDQSASQNEYNTLQALGREVATCATVYYWPHDQRAQSHEKSGILHVKCAVADGKMLFISSANMTEYAFSINMELGVLISGGQLPEQVERHFSKLAQMSVFRTV